MGHSLIQTKSLVRPVLSIYWHRAIQKIENPLYLPCVMVQEQFICNNPRASYEVTKGISLQMADMSSMAKASDEAELTQDDIPCAALADPLDSRTVPALKWWLL